MEGGRGGGPREDFLPAFFPFFLRKSRKWDAPDLLVPLWNVLLGPFGVPALA